VRHRQFGPSQEEPARPPEKKETCFLEMGGSTILSTRKIMGQNRPSFGVCEKTTTERSLAVTGGGKGPRTPW